ncbi:MAG: tRNA epoxyqueuosine(34) reductase QueG [Pseudomonadota bacterium]
MPTSSFSKLAEQIKQWANEFGFQQAAITDTNLHLAEKKFQIWLDNNMHGDMEYMSRHGLKRTRPELLEPGTARIISLRMNYYPEDFSHAEQVLSQADTGYISRYALGRDYHKLIRQRLKKLVSRINENINNNQDYQYRVFTDSAPILEKSIAEKAGLGWIGKHSNLINSQAGSWFFLAEIYTNLPLPIDQSIAINGHCGSCEQCIIACPTQAIVKPYVVDARKCISYLTIENRTTIPIEYRKAMGNRIYGCDDCQLVCPWNKFSSLTNEVDFYPRHKLDKITLLELFSWSKKKFLDNFQGSPIRRIGHLCWLRNIAIALGNYLAQDTEDTQIVEAMNKALKLYESEAILIEHIQWAIGQKK